MAIGGLRQKWNNFTQKHFVQQRVAGSGGVPISPKLPSLRFDNFGYPQNVNTILKFPDSFLFM